jgi:hypothetical protein
MRNPALNPLYLVLVLVAHTACVPPAASPALSTLVVSQPLEMDDHGAVKMGAKRISLEEVTRCNPAAHAEALRAQRLGTAESVVGSVTFYSGAGSLTALLLVGLAGDISKTPLPVVGVLSAGYLVFFASGMTYLALPSDRDHRRKAVNLYNQGRPPCGPPLRPTGPAKAP